MTVWFPRWSPDGRKVLGESGDGWITVGGVGVVPGFGPPVWFSNEWFLYSHDTGLWRSDGTKLYDWPLIELAYGGRLWAGREPGRNVLVISDGREIPNAGQPAISADGQLIYRTGDDKIEPTICRTARAWGNGRGLIIGQDASSGGNFTVAGPEYRPRLVDTPEGPWLLTMTQTELRLRPFGADRGFRITPGDNQNLHADVVCVGRILQVIYQNDAGQTATWLRSIDDPRLPFAVPNPGTTVPDSGIPNMPQIPEHARQFVRQMHARFITDQTPATEDAARAFTRMCAEQMAFSYPAEGWCSKAGDPTRPPTKDCLARRYEGKFEGWDILASAGRHGPRKLSDNPLYHDLTGQHPIDVRPVNHLGLPSGDDDDPGDTDPPRPPSGLTLEQRVARIEAHLRSFPR